MRIHSSLLFVSVCLLFCSVASGWKDSSLTLMEAKVQPDKIIKYKTTEQGDLRLHVFNPESHKVSDQTAAVVFFFGGGWVTGKPQQFYQQADHLAKNGIVAMAAEYRIKNRHKTSPFECVEDGKSAIRWVREHSKELGINPKMIVAAGGSAGGHIAACTDVVKDLENKKENLEVSSRPNAMILFNPVLDTSEHSFKIRGDLSEEKKRTISPNHNVRKEIVPTLVFHGTADKTVPFKDAEQFEQLMKQAGNRCELVAFKDKGHGFFNHPAFHTNLKNDSNFQKTMQASLEFLASLGFTKSAATTKEQTDSDEE